MLCLSGGRGTDCLLQGRLHLRNSLASLPFQESVGVGIYGSNDGSINKHTATENCADSTLRRRSSNIGLLYAQESQRRLIEGI
jgi:hypothetical protein